MRCYIPHECIEVGFVVLPIALPELLWLFPVGVVKLGLKPLYFALPPHKASVAEFRLFVFVSIDVVLLTGIICHIVGAVSSGRRVHIGLRAIHGQLVIIYTQPVPLSITVSKQADLKN